MRAFEVVFAQRGTFVATRAAQDALEAHGFSVGPSQRGAPRAVMFGDYAVEKWRNLSHDDRREIHGTLSGDGREGPVFFRLLPAAPDAAARAAEAMRASALRAEAASPHHAPTGAPDDQIPSPSKAGEELK